MNFEIPNFAPAIPEMFVLAMTFIILLVDLFITDKGRVLTHILSVATLAIAAVLTISLSSAEAITTFNGSYIADPMSDLLKVFIYLTSAGVLIYSRGYLMERNLLKGEFYVLVLFAVLGMMIMVSAHSFITLYLGLELMSLCLYALTALDRDSKTSTEAAMKYFVLGALASGLLLYGMSMIYGMTGSLDIAVVGEKILEADQNNIVLIFGLVFIVIGLAFKLGAVPFHMWIPDVYHGAPTPVTLFIGTAPKLAAFAMVMRLLVEGMQGLHIHWQEMLIVLAVLSMAVGNLIAIAQTNLKRMLAYSTIAHVGFILLALMAGTTLAYSAGMFYVIAYVIMGLAGFGMIILLSRKGFEADNIDDFKGLSDRSPWFAFMMMIIMLSMAGVPPTLGFYAKLAVLEAVVNTGMIWLAVVAVIFSIVGVFYYLRVIKVMYFDKAEDSQPIEASIDMKVVLSLNSLAVLALGIFPAGLMALCIAAL